MFIKKKSKDRPNNHVENKLGNYAFIDSQNLNLGTQRMGWKLDWRKFRNFLKIEYNVTKAFTFIGYMSENEHLYEYMHELGYIVVLKPTSSITSVKNINNKDNDNKDKPIKGNVDVELVLYAIKEMNNYNQAIIVSGDGDFYSLIEYLDNIEKIKTIITPNWQYSSLLKTYDSKIIRLDKLKKQLRYIDRKK
ncbi:MAG TPA: NYN domain-containing protein [Patescibacteria group bacterium]|nr:NYN domain-containing protein [Patescibacteria group bacterium]